MLPDNSAEDYRLIERMSHALVELLDLIAQDATLTLRKLRHLLFGPKTEKTDQVCPPAHPARSGCPHRPGRLHPPSPGRRSNSAPGFDISRGDCSRTHDSAAVRRKGPDELLCRYGFVMCEAGEVKDPQAIFERRQLKGAKEQGFSQALLQARAAAARFL